MARQEPELLALWLPLLSGASYWAVLVLDFLMMDLSGVASVRTAEGGV